MNVHLLCLHNESIKHSHLSLSLFVCLIIALALAFSFTSHLSPNFKMLYTKWVQRHFRVSINCVCLNIVVAVYFIVFLQKWNTEMSINLLSRVEIYIFVFFSLSFFVSFGKWLREWVCEWNQTNKKRTHAL